MYEFDSSGVAVCPECQASRELTETTEQVSFSRLEMVSRLGSGGFGEVWLGRDRETQRSYAVKISWRLSDDSQISSVIREVNASRLLDHPNISTIRQVGRNGDRVYIVSDLVEGITLGDWRRRTRPEPDDSIRICGQLASILQHAHEMEIIHRDLKPSNVIVRPDGQPHLLDFGLAREGLNEASAAIERYRTMRVAIRGADKSKQQIRIMGTPAYMSPEQALGKAYCVDGRSDVYSLGVILYELLTGRRPFTGRGDKLYHDIIHRRPKPPRRLVGGISPDIQAICIKAIEKDPQDRYQTAAALAEDCSRVLAGQELDSRNGLAVRGWWVLGWIHRRK